MGISREVTREETTFIEHVRIYQDRVVVVLAKQATSTVGNISTSVYHELKVDEQVQERLVDVKQHLASLLLRQLEEEDSLRNREDIWRSREDEEGEPPENGDDDERNGDTGRGERAREP